MGLQVEKYVKHGSQFEEAARKQQTLFLSQVMPALRMTLPGLQSAETVNFNTLERLWRQSSSEFFPTAGNTLANEPCTA